MSGKVGGIGSKSGIISDVKLDHDAQKYAWHRYVGADVNHGSSYLDFSHYIFQGSGTTESAGLITIGTGGAGIYWVGVSLGSYGSESSGYSFNLNINGSNVNGTRLYRGGSHSGYTYVNEASSWTVRLAGGDTIGINGAGYIAGSTSDSMSHFSGCRIGSKS